MIEKALWLRSIFRKNNIDLESSQLEQLVEYVQRLLEWNKKINLVSRKDEQHIWEHHILHSAALVLLVDYPIGAKVVDIGTGGGLPGIPLKILRPDLSLTLIDATRKKVDAVNEMIARLSLKNATAIWARAEELSMKAEYKGQYSYGVSRAVADLTELVRWTRPLLTTAEQQWRSQNKRIIPRAPALLVLKGGNLEKEIVETLRKYRDISIEQHELTFEGGEMLRAANKKLLYIHW
ncbi:MAG: 16S rRNA (guanine(527)-N(7))-methyltransferase RsmG [Bacteroidetes bacterium]|nr:16S rRNA (guanine(527)-N(7))-methyltransferase RsmG [Bacteroidota bacterium]